MGFVCSENVIPVKNNYYKKSKIIIIKYGILIKKIRNFAGIKCLSAGDEAGDRLLPVIIFRRKQELDFRREQSVCFLKGATVITSN